MERKLKSKTIVSFAKQQNGKFDFIEKALIDSKRNGVIHFLEDQYQSIKVNEVSNIETIKTFLNQLTEEDHKLISQYIIANTKQNFISF